MTDSLLQRLVTTTGSSSQEDVTLTMPNIDENEDNDITKVIISDKSKPDVVRSEKERPRVKVTVVGGSQVGKSALAVRFLTRRFIGEYHNINCK